MSTETAEKPPVAPPALHAPVARKAPSLSTSEEIADAIGRTVHFFADATRSPIAAIVATVVEGLVHLLVLDPVQGVRFVTAPFSPEPRDGHWTPRPFER